METNLYGNFKKLLDTLAKQFDILFLNGQPDPASGALFMQTFLQLQGLANRIWLDLTLPQDPENEREGMLRELERRDRLIQGLRQEIQGLQEIIIQEKDRSLQQALRREEALSARIAALEALAVAAPVEEVRLADEPVADGFIADDLVADDPIADGFIADAPIAEMPAAEAFVDDLPWEEEEEELEEPAAEEVEEVEGREEFVQELVEEEVEEVEEDEVAETPDFMAEEGFVEEMAVEVLEEVMVEDEKFEDEKVEEEKIEKEKIEDETAQDERIDEKAGEKIEERAEEKIIESIDGSIDESIEESIDESIDEIVLSPWIVEEPVQESAQKPVPEIETAWEPALKPAQDPAPAQDVAPAPVPEPAPEVEPELDSEPFADEAWFFQIDEPVKSQVVARPEAPAFSEVFDLSPEDEAVSGPKPRAPRPEPQIPVPSWIRERKAPKRKEKEPAPSFLGDLFQSAGQRVVDLLSTGGRRESLEKTISLNDSFLFQRELFGKDSGLYKVTLMDLNEIEDPQEVADYLSSHFPHWDWESQPVQRFVHLVNQRLQHQA